MAALSRMAANIHKKVSIKPGDTIIFSSNPIPGNEKAVSRVINELSAKGADVIFQDVHVSGHACQEEIKLIYSLVKPKYSIPVHGEFRHLKAQAGIAESLGIPKENIFIMHSGDVMELNDESAEITGKVHTGAILVDGLGVGDVGNIVLRDRQHPPRSTVHRSALYQKILQTALPGSVVLRWSQRRWICQILPDSLTVLWPWNY